MSKVSKKKSKKEQNTQGEIKVKQAKGEKTRKAVAIQLALRLGIDPNDIDDETLLRLQDEDQNNAIEEDGESDIWQELILQKRAKMFKKEMESEENLEKMAEDINHSLFQKVNGILDEAPIYLDLQAIKTNMRKKRSQAPELYENENKSKQLDLCSRLGPPIPHDAQWRKIWDYFIIVVAIYSTFTIPVDFAFQPEPFDEMWYIALDWFTTIVYIVDIVIQFRTTYIDNYGQIISSYKLIAINYVGEITFWLDWISLLANPLTENIPLMKFVGILKIARVLRIKQIIVEANMDRTKKAYLNGLFFTFLLVCYIHLTACLWYYVLSNSKQILKEFEFPVDERELVWVPPFWFNNYSASTFWTGGKENQYWTCVYYCVLVLGGNELGPSNQIEQLYIVSINLLGAIVNAQVFGELAVILSQLGRKSASFQAVIDTANTAMSNMNLPQELRIKIRKYFQKVQTTQAQQDELDQFLSQISPSLKLKVQSQIFSTVIKQKNTTIQEVTIAILQGATSVIAQTPNASPQELELQLKQSSAQNMIEQNQGDSNGDKNDTQSSSKRSFEFIPLLVSKLGTSLNIPEEKVIEQDYDGADKGLYYIGKGDCEVRVRDCRGNEHEEIRVLAEGDHFGEVALLYRCKRSASVISRNYNTLANMEDERFRELIAEYPEYEIKLKQHVRQNYKDPKIKFILDMLQRVDYFKNLDDEILYDLMFSLESKQYEAGSVILASEQTIKSVLFIENGTVDVYTNFEGNEFVIERLFQGSAINYQAFFMQDQMYVDIKCQKDVKLLELPFDKLDELKSRYSDLGFNKKVLSYHQRILRQEKKYPLDYILQIPKSIAKINQEQASREIRLKNVIMRIIIEIRERKKKPKLSDFLNVYREKKHEPNAKEEFQKKFLILYGNEDPDDKEEDVKFDKLMSFFDRCQKQLVQQQQAISHMVKRANNLIERREKKEKVFERKLNGESEIESSSEDSQSQDPGSPLKKKKPLLNKNINDVRSPSKKNPKEENHSDESEGERQERERRRIETETKQIEDRYLNENSLPDSTNLEKLTKLAGKPKIDQHLGFMRSQQLNQNSIKEEMDVEEDEMSYGEGEESELEEGNFNFNDKSPTSKDHENQV